MEDPSCHLYQDRDTSSANIMVAEGTDVDRSDSNSSFTYILCFTDLQATAVVSFAFFNDISIFGLMVCFISNVIGLLFCREAAFKC